MLNISKHDVSWICIFFTLALIYGCPQESNETEMLSEKIRKGGGFVPIDGKVELYIHNNTINNIYVSKSSWHNFGLCCPLRGAILAGECGSFECHWLEATPSETKVIWIDQSTGQEYSQQIELKRLTQHRFKNRVHFILNLNNVWTVQYDDEYSDEARNSNKV